MRFNIGLELTTQRTGMAIAELPEVFVGKIKALRNRLADVYPIQKFI